MDIPSLKIAVLVARQGSFAAAARALGVDPSSVSRTVAALETDLGVRLFQRSTRTLSMTEEGAGYIARVTPLLDEFDRASAAARKRSRDPAGLLKMTTSMSFAQRCIVPYLGEFSERYPEVEIELLTTDTNLDLVGENIDLAIRLAPAPKGDLVSTKLRTTRYIVCASPEYLAAHAAIIDPIDLQNHDCLRFALPGYRTSWRFRRDGVGLQDVPITGKIVISNALSLREAALNGLGVALLPDWLVGSDLDGGFLMDVLPEYKAAASSFDTAAWALYPSRSYLPQKVRVMIDFLRGKLN